MTTLFAAVTISCFSFSTAFADFAYGDRGEEIVEIQKQLAVLHYNVGTVDGVFGPATEKAVKEFQAAKGLTVDGVVNDGTYRNLMNKEMPPDRYGNHAMTRTILRTAYSMLGVPYMFGGMSPGGFDCSGFVCYVFRQAGISLPRMADTQYDAVTHVNTSSLRSGDLVFFQTYAPGASHVGIYVGDGKFIHASSSKGITVSEVFTGYWGARYLGAGRVYN
ncbi:MAG: C40 family peptidase [Acidaminococcaceae bacterium]|nr:C40 family peptidase [Acidaminococcaceae bacterium]MBO5637831.1 C40 family peptidase [Acidaminococcaceae bacterium]MBR1493840.1 C40 family peptidase [Acidaminococcaceae bacterium]MBR1661344.1 C40 family peptidase [Acidaminococcaceae bacterium]